MSDETELPSLMLVTGVSRIDVLSQRLASSPCLQRGGLPWVAHFNVDSAATAFNGTLDSHPKVDWLVWVHQDVYLPAGWDTRFAISLRNAQIRFPNLAVAGAYGVSGTGPTAVRAGHVLDRGNTLKENTPVPFPITSLDELLVAVRADSRLRMDPALGFDFYATDLVLQAHDAGLSGAVIDGYCEHWSDTPSSGPMPRELIDRVKANGRVFESKWAHRFPLTTPCFEINRMGDVAEFIDSVAWVAS